MPIPILHQFDYARTGHYQLTPASLRDRILAQLIDGIILGVICSAMFYLLSGGRLFSVWVSPILPQYLLEIPSGYSPDAFARWWGGNYFAVHLSYGKTIYLNYPAPILWLIYGAYYGIFTAVYGQTPGKMMKKLVVMTEQQARPDFFLSLWRWLSYLLSFLPLGIGFWWIAFNDRHRTWHDILTHTHVYNFERGDRR